MATILEKLIYKYPDKLWNWQWLSENPNITMDFVERHLDKPWNWNWLSENQHITMDFIERHPDNPWNWEWLSENPNITIGFIERHLDNINWKKLSMNTFHYYETPLYYYKQRKQQTIKQTSKIEEELIAITWHPGRFIDWCLSIEERREFDDDDK